MNNQQLINQTLYDYDLIETDKQCLNNISSALLDVIIQTENNYRDAPMTQSEHRTLVLTSYKRGFFAGTLALLSVVIIIVLINI